LYPLARGCRTIWRGEKWLRRRDALRDGVSFATTRSHQLAEGCRRRRRRFRFIDFRCPAFTLISTLYAREGADGQAVVCPLLRGSSATRGVAPNQHRGLRRAFSPAFRAGSLYPLARGCRTIWRGEKWFIGFGGAMLLDRIGPPGRLPRRRS